jgi:hypothetical protein
MIVLQMNLDKKKEVPQEGRGLLGGILLKVIENSLVVAVLFPV